VANWLGWRSLFVPQSGQMAMAALTPAAFGRQPRHDLIEMR